MTSGGPVKHGSQEKYTMFDVNQRARSLCKHALCLLFTRFPPQSATLYVTATGGKTRWMPGRSARAGATVGLRSCWWPRGLGVRQGGGWWRCGQPGR